MKGKDIVPGKDPVLDKALADLRKGLKDGEDPFYYDLNGLPTDTSETSIPAAQRTSPLNGHGTLTTAEASLASRIILNVRRYGIKSALAIGALIGLGFVAVYALGFWRGKATVQTEGTIETVQLTGNARPPMPTAPTAATVAPKQPAENPDTMSTAIQPTKTSASPSGATAPSQSVRARVAPSTQVTNRTKKPETLAHPPLPETPAPPPTAEPKQPPIFQNLPPE